MEVKCKATHCDVLVSDHATNSLLGNCTLVDISLENTIRAFPTKQCVILKISRANRGVDGLQVATLRVNVADIEKALQDGTLKGMSTKH